MGQNPGRNDATGAQSLARGDRVTNRPFPREEPKHGTVTRCYTATPSGTGQTTPLYEVHWDGEPRPTAGHHRCGLVRVAIVVAAR